MTDHKGRRVLVTGAASGIGAATCQTLARAGWSIAGIDQQSQALTHVIRALREEGHAAIAEVADLSLRSDVSRAVDAAAGQLGGLDAVANVAGIGGYTGDIVETSIADWRRVIDVDLTSAFLVSRAAIPHLRQAGGGAIVQVSSQYGLVGCAGSPAYCAAKAGVIGLTRAMAVDHAPDRIRVNCVCPGPIETPMLARSRVDPRRAPEGDRAQGRVLLGQPGEPADVAALIAFLLSEAARNMTGSIVTTDGGWTAA